MDKSWADTYVEKSYLYTDVNHKPVFQDVTSIESTLCIRQL